MSRLPLTLSGALLLGLALVRPFDALGQEVDLTALTLKQAEALLQTKNRELQAARRAVEAAGAGTLAAGARPNPTLSLGVSQINLKEGVGSGSPSEKIVDSNVRIDQVIERGDKRELRLANARSLESASNADLSEAQRQQRLALRSAYYDLLFAQDKVDIGRDTISLFEGSVRAAELRLKAGDIAAADVARLRVDALRAQNDARAAEADQRRAQLALAYMIGAEGRAIGIRAVDPWPSIYAERPGGSVDELIEARPDVRAAKSRFEAAQNARELARSLRTRDVSVGASYDHYPVNPGYATGSSFGVFLSVPLFTGYYYEGEIRRAEVDYSAAMEALEKVRAQARTDIARSFSDLQATAERVQRYDESLLVEAKRAADSAEFAYKNGAIGVMDLLDARRTLRAIQIDAASARNDHSKALAAWQAGIGRVDTEAK